MLQLYLGKRKLRSELWVCYRGKLSVQVWKKLAVCGQFCDILMSKVISHEYGKEISLFSGMNACDGTPQRKKKMKDPTR